MPLSLNGVIVETRPRNDRIEFFIVNKNSHPVEVDYLQWVFGGLCYPAHWEIAKNSQLAVGSSGGSEGKFRSFTLHIVSLLGDEKIKGLRTELEKKADAINKNSMVASCDYCQEISSINGFVDHRTVGKDNDNFYVFLNGSTLATCQTPTNQKTQFPKKALEHAEYAGECGSGQMTVVWSITIK